MKKILWLTYAIIVLLLLLTGWMYPTVWGWSFWVGVTWTIYLALSLATLRSDTLLPARISAWAWQGLSGLVSTGLLLLHVVRKEGVWFIVAAGLVASAVLITVALSIGCRSEKQSSVQRS